MRRPRRLLAKIGSRVRAILGAPEKPAPHERLEERIAGRGIQTPQSLDLLLGQVKTRDFAVLATDDLEPVRGRRLNCVHLCCLLHTFPFAQTVSNPRTTSACATTPRRKSRYDTMYGEFSRGARNFSRAGDHTMTGLTTAYVVAIATLLFCGISALTLVNTVRQFDPPETRELPEKAHDKTAV